MLLRKTVDGLFASKMLRWLSEQLLRNILPTLQTCSNRSTCIYGHHGIQILPRRQLGIRIEQHASTSFDDKRHTATQEQTHASQQGRLVGRLVGTEQKLLENPTCLCIFPEKVINSTWQGSNHTGHPLCTNSWSTKWFPHLRLLFRTFRDVLVLRSTLEIVLANILRDVLVLLDVADVHQCSKVDFPYCCFVCLFMTSFHSLSTAAFASGINIARSERSFAHSLGFPRLASLRERPPESSEPYVVLDFSKFAEQNNIQSLYSLLPRFTLESITYSPGF